MRSTTGGSARSNLLRQRCVAPTCCSSHAHGRKRAGHENKLRKGRGAARGKREGKNRGETEALSESSLIRGRRDSLLVTGTTATSVVLASWAEQLFGEVPLAQAIAEKPVEVSNYLPASSTGIAGFYEFVPGDRETPAIRAGTIGKYRFSMPGSWIRRTVSRTLYMSYVAQETQTLAHTKEREREGTKSESAMMCLSSGWMESRPVQLCVCWCLVFGFPFLKNNDKSACS